jgi:hypothetical protein
LRRAAPVSRVVAAALLGTASLSMTLSAGGCAMSSPGDLTPAIDSTLPEIDAAFAPASPLGSDGAAGASAAGDAAAVPDARQVDVKAVDASTAPDAAAAAAASPIPRPGPGEVLITEVMYDPLGTEPDTEWVELFNPGATPRSLSGLTLADTGGRTHVLAPGVVLAPRTYAVLARNRAAAVAAKVPSAAVLYEYGAGLPSTAGVLLVNGATGGVSLADGSVVITSSSYGGWFTQSGGSSVQLRVLDGALGAQKSSWCLSLNAWAIGADKGTPGAASDCP